MRKRTLPLAAFTVLLSVIGVLMSDSIMGQEIHETLIFGPTYVRGKGTPVTHIDRFSVINPGGKFRIHVENGEQVGGNKKGGTACSAASISINRVGIVDTSEFNQKVAYLDRKIADGVINYENVLEVWLASKPGCFIKVEIFGTDQDTIPPIIRILYPEDGSTIETDEPNIQVTYSDEWLGVDLSTFYAEIDGKDVSAKFTKEESQASFKLTAADALTDGEHVLVASIEDVLGNSSTDSSTFLVSTRRLRAIASASPTSGVAPLAVIFTENGDDPTSTIIRYRWDFQGDGVWETSDPVAKIHTFTYQHGGAYNAVLEVQNQRGQTALDTVEIRVNFAPPVASASASPSNGQIPLNVSFSGLGTDPDGHIVLYEWDFDGDGTYDWSSPSSGNTTHTYNTVGTYHAIFRVTDNDGLKATAPPILTEVRAGSTGSPTADATAQPTSGNAPLTVCFTGVGSDPDGQITLYEWDFDGDGTYDWSSPSSGNTCHAYSMPGVYYPVFRVRDNDGKTGIDYVQVTVRVGISLAISDPDDTFNPRNGETIGIITNVSAAIPVRLFIKAKSGLIVRTLVNNETRPPGAHTDVWDGRDDNGAFVLDGPYYAILQYFMSGEWKTLDLGNSTGGVEFLPQRQALSQYYFSPYENDLLHIRWYQNRAAEITLFVGELWVDERVRTVLNRELFSAGWHAYFWDGYDDAGYIRHPETSLILGMWGYTLSDNAMYVDGGRPVVSNAYANPNYFDPSTHAVGDTVSTVRVSFELSKNASVFLRVYSLPSARLVRTVSYSGVPSGSNTLEWDGRNWQGNYVADGDYQIGVQSVDSQGNESMVQYVYVRLFY